jgi:hypothetical protein
MKDKPILMSTPMVQALLAGQKTQTRRILKPQPAYGCYYAMNENGDKALHLIVDGTPEKYCAPIHGNTTDHRLPCPQGKIGDLLWVREGFRFNMVNNDPNGGDKYKADYPNETHVPNSYGKPWKPSIFMPRSASRITLEITSIKVKRLQDISDNDSLFEGVKNTDFYVNGRPPRVVYSYLWESLHGKGSWDLNPWVWVLEFKPYLINIDNYLLSQNRDIAK